VDRYLAHNGVAIHDHCMLAADATRVGATSWHLTQHGPVTRVLACVLALPPQSPPRCAQTAIPYGAVLVAEDDVGQERGLMGARRGHDQQVFLERDPQPVPVVGPAEEHRVLVRFGDPVPQREQGADPARAAQRGQAAQRSHRPTTWAKPLPG
jgi:hypothetical protein